MKWNAKLLIVILKSLIVFTILLSYYLNCNVVSSTESIKKDIDTLISKSADKPDELSEVRIKIVNRELNSNGNINADIKDFYKGFIVSWRKADSVHKKNIPSYSKKNEFLFSSLASVLKPLKNNQLICCGIIYIIFLVFFLSALYTNLLRDIVGDRTFINARMASLATPNKPNVVAPPYSLSRSQVAFWISALASFYVHDVLWRGYNRLEINSTMLILMGISSGTFAFGVIIDTIEIEKGEIRNQDEPSSNNFLRDILSDNSGISLQRFQNVIWTIIAFIVYFYKYNQMKPGSGLPELDYTLLALTGISSATYLTLKTRENVVLKNELRIHLELDASIVDQDRTAIGEKKLEGVTVNITEAKSGITVKAIPDTSAKGDFVVSNIKSGIYNVIAEWPEAITGKNLKGDWKDLSLNNGDKKVITITLRLNN